MPALIEGHEEDDEDDVEQDDIEEDVRFLFFLGIPLCLQKTGEV